MQDFMIGQYRVAADAPPLIVAEMSANHNQSLDRALEIVDAAAKAGAHAIKLQTYTADTMTIDHDQGEFIITDPNSLWHGYKLHQLYQEAMTPWEWHQPLFERAKQHGMLGFSTPFDETAVDFLESLNVPCHKIASFENTDLPLLAKVAATGKPIIISTGMASIAELDQAITTLRQHGAQHIIMLKCTSNYPANPSDSNLRTIPHLADLFACYAGLSDHTMGVGAAVAAVALGAVMIEKHFTLARDDGGVDSAFSMESHEMTQLVKETHTAWQALGKVSYGASAAEIPSLQFRRSLYIVQDIAAGEILSAAHIRRIRPGRGLAPRYWDEVIGRRAKHDLKRGTALRLEDLL